MNKRLTQRDVDEIIKMHKRWLRNDPYGKRADFTDTNISGLNLSDARLDFAVFTCAICENTIFINTRLNRALFDGVYANGARMEGAWMCFAKAEGTNFTAARLCAAELKDTDFTGSLFLGADLLGANFDGATLNGCDFLAARKERAHFDNVITDDKTTGLYDNAPDGEIHGYMRVSRFVAEVVVPENARRSAEQSGGIFAEEVVVLNFFTKEGDLMPNKSLSHGDEGTFTQHDGEERAMKVGETYKSLNFGKVDLLQKECGFIVVGSFDETRKFFTQE